jgi:hypothetical protein
MYTKVSSSVGERIYISFCLVVREIGDPLKGYLFVTIFRTRQFEVWNSITASAQFPPHFNVVVLASLTIVEGSVNGLEESSLYHVKLRAGC